MMNKKERKAIAQVLDWYFERPRSPEEVEAYLLKLGFSKDYAKWRANT